MDVFDLQQKSLAHIETTEFVPRYLVRRNIKREPDYDGAVQFMISGSSDVGRAVRGVFEGIFGGRKVKISDTFGEKVRGATPVLSAPNAEPIVAN